MIVSIFNHLLESESELDELELDDSYSELEELLELAEESVLYFLFFSKNSSY